MAQRSCCVLRNRRGVAVAEIVMYGADWCGDCQRSKQYFADHSVEYTYIDLVEQPEQYEEVTRRNGGAKSIPVIVFADGTHLTEPSNDQLREKLDH